jgi:predicted enzyme related to lactoylglutathione lyase
VSFSRCIGSNGAAVAGSGEPHVVNSHGRFAWYELITTDVAAARAFYAEVVGWGAQDASVPGRAYILLTAGTDMVAGVMELPESARQAGEKPCWVGYVGVNDVDAAADTIERLGGAVYVPPTDIPDISRFSVFADPQTATLALVKPLNPDQGRPTEIGAPGRVGWHELLAADWQKALAFYGELFDWQKVDTDVDPMGTMFSAGGQPIGGMFAKPANVPVPLWLYYFNVGDIDTATKRVTAGGGRILDDPIELAGGIWVVQCTDPQGAMFGLQGMRARTPIGYFERVGSRAPSDTRSRRWSW